MIEEYLLENYHKKTFKEMAKDLNLSTKTVNDYVRKLVLEGKMEGKSKYWNKKEEKYLKENMYNYTIKELAEKFNVTQLQMRKKIYYMQKKAGRQNKKHKDKEQEIAKREEEAYKRMINQKKDKGIGDKVFDYPLVKGKKYKVVKLALRKGQVKVNETFKGELIQITDDFFVLKNKNYSECFLKKDYLLGEIEIREV